MQKNKRGNYLINKDFQLKLSTYISFLVFISSIVYPIAIYDYMMDFIQHLSQYTPTNTADFKQNSFVVMVILIIWQLGFTSLVFLSCIFMTHKVAGPMYKLQKFLSDRGKGINNGKLMFRKGDYFHEIATQFNETFEAIEKREDRDHEVIDELKSYLDNLGMVIPEDKKIVLEELSNKLEEFKKRYNEE